MNLLNGNKIITWQLQQLNHW